MRIYKGPVKEGWYVSSGSGCGLDCAIQLEYVQTPNECVCFSFSPEFARQLARLIIEVSNDYDNGIETGHLG